MGKRRRRGRQPSMWVASTDLPRSAGHPFYERLNRVLDAAGFDAFVEEQCTKFYADGVGRPSLAPGRSFRLLLLGYVEGLDSERAIAWRAADSLSLRQFLDVSLDAAPPDHSTVSRTRQRIDVETHLAVFTWVRQRLADAGLVGGKTVGIDAPTLEANAALRSIVRRDAGAGYETFLRGLAAASGIPTPTRAELARLDRKRAKKGANDDWTHPQDPDAKITTMKDGRTRLAHKAEHAVDLETGAVVGVSVQEKRLRMCSWPVFSGEVVCRSVDGRLRGPALGGGPARRQPARPQGAEALALTGRRTMKARGTRPRLSTTFDRWAELSPTVQPLWNRQAPRHAAVCCGRIFRGLQLLSRYRRCSLGS